MRREDWPMQLAAVLEAHATRTFAWGTCDCCTFAFDAVLAMTGDDWMAEQRGQYLDEASAAAVIGGALADKIDALCRAAGAEEIAPAFAQRGDVVIIHYGDKDATGIVVDDRVAAVAPVGLIFLPRRTVRRAWRV